MLQLLLVMKIKYYSYCLIIVFLVKLAMDFSLIIAYLVIHFINMELAVVITLGNFIILKNTNNIYIYFLSKTCNGLNNNNCLSCTSPRHLYNNICCDYSW